MTDEGSPSRRKETMRFCFTSLLVLLTVAAVSPVGSHAQALADTAFTWQGYSQTARCRLRIYTTPPGSKRTHVVLLQELAANEGPTTAFDLPYLAEEIGRHFELDPAAAYWILHWGAFSYEGAVPDARKELFLRATFSRTKSQRLSSPRWDLITRSEVRAYTNRQFD